MTDAQTPEGRILRKLVIAWDAEQDEEFDEAISEARTALGLRLADDADDVIDLVRQEAEKEPTRCCVHGKFPVRTPCQMCNPYRR